MDFKTKCNDIADMLMKMDQNDKRIILKYIIMHDLKLYTEVLFEEQKRLEKECGIKGVQEYESFENSEHFANHDLKDGYLGYCDIDGVYRQYPKDEKEEKSDE